MRSNEIKISHTWSEISKIGIEQVLTKGCEYSSPRQIYPDIQPIHRSQDDTETKIVVNVYTRRSIPHIHYVGLIRVTTIDGLYITDLCESKIAVSGDVQTEMRCLRTEGQPSLSINPTYCVFSQCRVITQKY